MRLHVFFSILEPFFAKIVEQLRADGIVSEVTGTIWGLQSLPYLRRLDIRPRLVVLSEVFAALPRRIDYDYIRSYEDAAGGITAPLLITADRVVANFEYECGMAHVEAALRAVEAAFDRNPPDALFMDDVSCIPSYAHYLVAKQRGIRTLMLGPSRLPGRAMIYSNPYALFEDTIGEYERIRGQGMTEAERKEASDYLDALTSSKKAPPYMAYMGQRPAVRRDDLRIVKDLWRAVRTDSGNYTVVSPWKAVRNRLARIAHSRLYSFYWEEPRRDERYVLFPLHYQPEASTSVRAPFFMDQCSLAENIARALPAGYRLYVKEHSAGLGRRSYSEFRRLRRIPSVRLINPSLDSGELLKNAACVAVITGTMGWEALVHRVPVVTFGRVFFEACASVHRAGAPDEYPSVLRRALATRPDRRDVEDFTAALLRTSFPGRTGHPFYLPDVLDDDNVRSIAGRLASLCAGAQRAIA